MPKGNTGDGSSSEPVKGESFRGGFTRLEREYVLARSILAARHATGMSKGPSPRQWERRGKTVVVGTPAEATPRLEMLQRIANVTGLSFQIGIEPLETPESSSTKRSSKRAPTRKASAKSNT